MTVYQGVSDYRSFLGAAHRAGDLATPEGFQTLGPEKKKENLREIIEKAKLSETSKTRLLDGAKLLCDFNTEKVARL